MFKLELISQYPLEQSQPTPLLFIHGGWHGAWCWRPYFMPYFVEQGYEVHALSLRGHGASQGYEGLRWHSTADYVADVAQVVQRLGKDPILIGHSMGGYVLQKYLEKYAPPATVLLTSLPVKGIFGFFWRYFKKHPWNFINQTLRFSPYLMIGSSSLVQELFFSKSISERDLETYFAQMQEESYRIGLDAWLFARPRPARVRDIPLLVVAAEEDKVFTLEEQRETATAYGAELTIVPDLAHDAMLDTNWRAAAEVIGKWLDDGQSSG